MTEQVDVSVKVFADPKSDKTTCSMDDIRSFVKRLKEIEEEIADKKDEMKTMVEDFVSERGLPLKETKMAIRALKADIDTELVSTIYAGIGDLVTK